MENKIKVAAYCRVSTDLSDQIHSLSAQIKYFTEYISSQEEWELTEIYYDEGITGTSVKKRDGFNRMISDCENGKINLILTKEVSRFARNTVDTLNFTRRLSELKVGVIFMSDGIDTRDKDGELRLTIMASLAQEESRKISERTKWGTRRQMENGIVLGCGHIYGYRIESGKLIPVPDECEIVKQIFNSYLYERKGSATIAKELNQRGIPTLNGKLWGAHTVLKILRNEKYVGDLTQGKFYTESYLSHRRVPNKGDNPDMPLITITNHHDAIISRDVWDGVQEQLEERGKLVREGRKHSGKYWFSGKVSCGKCGKPFSITGNNTLPSRTLRCINRGRFGKEIQIDLNGDITGCDNNSVNEHVLEACVKHILEYIQIAGDKIVGELIEEIKQTQHTLPFKDIELLKAEIEKLKQKKRKAIDLMLEELITKDDLKQQTDFYDSEINRLTEEITENQNINAIQKKQLDGIRSYINEVGKAKKCETDNIEIYHEMVNKIIVRENRILDFYMNCVPFGFRIEYHTYVARMIKKYDIFIDNCEVIS